MAESFLSPLLMQIVEKLKSAVVLTLPNLDAPGPTIVYANPAFMRQTGYELEELIGESPRLFQGPRTNKPMLSRLRQALEQGEDFEGETWNYRKDGSAYRVRWYIRPIRDDHGDISHFFAVQEDVSLQVALVQDLLRRPELSFESLTLPSFVQLLEMEGRTCRLVVRRDGLRGVLYFDRGRVVGAKLGDLTGRDAALRLLSWDRVDLELGPLVDTPVDPLDEPLQHLLLESARLRDEAGRDGVGPRAETETTPFPESPDQVAHILEPVLRIEGTEGLALVHTESGRVLGAVGGRLLSTVKTAAALNAGMVRAKLGVIERLDLDDHIDEILVTLHHQYHLIRPIAGSRGFYVYAVFDRSRANLATARRELGRAERLLDVSPAQNDSQITPPPAPVGP